MTKLDRTGILFNHDQKLSGSKAAQALEPHDLCMPSNAYSTTEPSLKASSRLISDLKWTNGFFLLPCGNRAMSSCVQNPGMWKLRRPLRVRLSPFTLHHQPGSLKLTSLFHVCHTIFLTWLAEESNFPEAADPNPPGTHSQILSHAPPSQRDRKQQSLFALQNR